MDKQILIMCPSRSADGKRINSLTRLIKSWQETSTGNSDFLLGIDKDDSHNYPKYENILLDINDEWLTVAKKINYLSKKYLNNYKYVFFVGDDCELKTQGWEDIFLKEAVKYDKLVFYPNDMLQGERLSTHYFVSAALIKKFGFMSPECLEHMFVDNFWMAVGRSIGCLKYFNNIILEHNHYSIGKSQKDSLYEKNDSYYKKDEKEFYNYMNTKFLQDIKKVL